MSDKQQQVAMLEAASETSKTVKPKRKIVQISNGLLLCDDGSVWSWDTEQSRFGIRVNTYRVTHHE